jgi:hypothetical protein
LTPHRAQRRWLDHGIDKLIMVLEMTFLHHGMCEGDKMT